MKSNAGGKSHKAGYLVRAEGTTYFGEAPNGDRILSAESELKDIWASVMADKSSAAKAVTLDGDLFKTSAKLPLLTNKSTWLIGSKPYGTKIEGNGLGAAEPVIVANDGETDNKLLSRVRLDNLWLDPNRADYIGRALDLRWVNRFLVTFCNTYNDSITPSATVAPAVGSVGIAFSKNGGNRGMLYNTHVHKFDVNVDVTTLDWLTIEGMYCGWSRSAGVRIAEGGGANLGMKLKDLHFFRNAKSPILVKTTSSGRVGGKEIIVEDCIQESDAFTFYGGAVWGAATEFIFHENVNGSRVIARNNRYGNLANLPNPLPGLRGGPGMHNIEVDTPLTPLADTWFGISINGRLAWFKGAKRLSGWTTDNDNAVAAAVADGNFAILTTDGTIDNEKSVVINGICRRDSMPSIAIRTKNRALDDYRTFIGVRANGTVTTSELLSNDDIQGAVPAAQYFGIQHKALAGVGQVRLIGANSVQAAENITRLDKGVATFAKAGFVFGKDGTTRARCHILDANGGQIFSQEQVIGIPDAAEVLDLVVGIKALAAEVKELEVHSVVFH